MNCKNESFIKSRSFNLELTLNYLQLKCYMDLHFELINKFQNLIELKISIDSDKFEKKSNSISSPELKKLTFFNIKKKCKFDLSLLSKKLEFIQFGDFKLTNISISYKLMSSVIRIESAYFNSNVVLFQNLEHLQLEQFQALELEEFDEFDEQLVEFGANFLRSNVNLKKLVFVP